MIRAFGGKKSLATSTPAGMYPPTFPRRSKAIAETGDFPSTKPFRSSCTLVSVSCVNELIFMTPIRDAPL
jgi:hypothetical protein